MKNEMEMINKMREKYKSIKRNELIIILMVINDIVLYIKGLETFFKT